MLDKVFAAFDEHHIDYLPLKGVLLKHIYPKAEMRSMGDADVLIRVDQYDRIKPLMPPLGFAEVTESDHELIWQSEVLHLELHKRLVPSYHEAEFAYFGDGWDRAVKLQGCRYDMKPEDEYVFLFAHFAKHYVDGGIGIRHALDLWVYRRTNPDLDNAYIQTELKKLKLERFELPREEALELMKDEPYKVELINDLPEDVDRRTMIMTMHASKMRRFAGDPVRFPEGIEAAIRDAMNANDAYEQVFEETSKMEHIAEIAAARAAAKKAVKKEKAATKKAAKTALPPS